MPDKPVKSPKPESLDEIVSRSAIAIADQIQTAASWDASEMQLQIEAAGALKEFAKRAQIKLEGRHNITVATGRPDSVYGSVIVEYKKPGTLSSSRDAAANKALIVQLKQRFYDMNREENRNWGSMFGAGTDGKYFIFLRFRDDKWTDQEPLEVNRYSTERFLWALYNLGQKGKPYQPGHLNADFGSGTGSVAQEGVRALYEEILATDIPKAQVFFGQWKILFREVCGYDVENVSDKLEKLADFYLVKGKPQPAQLLFAVHTYYAILIKLLDAEIVSFFNPWMPRQVEKLQSATSSGKLKKELEELERGGIFHQMGITNFLEGDLFSWYLAVWSEPIQTLVRKMISKLDEYNPGTFSEDPAQSRDLLKKLYQQLFPKSVRHDLGEYYTPDWLAEHVLNEIGYEGDPDKRLLDPGCGSGTFLVMAINRIRRWYDLNREKCAYDEGELLKKILANVIGFDLNPLAVMAARTNYLVAIKDLIRHVDGVEIPVYLCDSIMTPAEYGDLFAGSLGSVAKVPCSAMKPPHLLVPKEVANSPRDVATYADVLESCVKNGYAPEEFLSRCKGEGLTITATGAHINLYEQLVRLDKENKDGIWARIIKNNFAPLFEGPESFHFVVGNPPWVRWSYLPDEYCQASWPLWEKYGLFQARGHQAKVNAGELDLSMLFTYGCLDSYVAVGGRLGFVITSEVWQSKVAGLGFRRFRLGSHGPHFRVMTVSDFVSVKPFEGAANKTTTFAAQKGIQHLYPVPYTRYKRCPAAGELVESDSWDKWAACLEKDLLFAFPVSGASGPWQLRPTRETGSGRVTGKSFYTARLGVRLDPYGVFFVHPIRMLGNRVLVRNAPELGKKTIPVVEAKLEQDFLYPAIRGRDIQRWAASPELLGILTNRGIHTDDVVPYQRMKRDFPLTYSYFRQFWELLKEKEDYWTYFGKVVEPAPKDVLDRRNLHWRQVAKPSAGGVRKVIQASDVPLYTASKVGPYTFQPFRVVWPRMASDVRAAVVGETSMEVGGETMPKKTVLASDVVTLVGFDEAAEAYYFCGCMNSVVVRSHLRSFSAPGRGFAPPSILNNIAIPRFVAGDKTMARLSELSRKCHEESAASNADAVVGLEEQVDRAAAEIWGVSEEELSAMKKALAEAKAKIRTGRASDEDE